MNFNKNFKRLDYNYDIIGEEIKRVFFNFLKFFDFNKIFFSRYEEPMNLLNLNKIIVQFSNSTVFINFEHLVQFSDELSDIIQEQYVRIEPYLGISFDEFFKNYVQKNLTKREFWVSFYNVPNKKNFKLVNCQLLNKLISISGIITNITDYFPKLLLGTFQCSNLSCNFKVWHVEESYIFMEPKGCVNCGNINWILNIKQSVFILLQEIKIQEIYKSLHGQIPRSINVFIKYNKTDILKLGKRFIFSGFLLVLPVKDLFSHTYSEKFLLQDIYFQNYNFSKNLKENISCNFYFWTSHFYPYKQYICKNIFKLNKYTTLTFIIDKCFFSAEEKKKILKIRNNQFLLTDFLNNFYPNVSISQELKIAILFMFIGRKKQTTLEKYITQSDINVCAIENMSFGKFHFIKNLAIFFPGIFYINKDITNKIKFNVSISDYIQHNEFCISTMLPYFSNRSIYVIDNFNIFNSQYQNLLFETIRHLNVLNFESRIKINLKNDTSLLVFVKPEKKKITILNETNTNSLLNNYNYNTFDLCFTLFNPYFEPSSFSECVNIKIVTYKKIKKFYYNRKSYLKKFHFYQYYSRFLEPNFSKKSYTFIRKLYVFMRKQIIISDIFFNKITIRHFETLIKLSEAISKFYLNLYIEEFQIKAGIRLLIFSIYSYTYSNYIFFQQNNNSKTNQKKNTSLPDSKQIKKTKVVQNRDIFKITFKEFEFLYKKLISELKKFAEMGIIGLPLRKLLFNLIKIFNYNLIKSKVITKLTLIVLIIRKLVLTRNILILIKHFPKKLSQFYINIICLNKRK
nr:minichromosome maintenance complex component 6-like [Cryptomonas curvata]